MREAAGRRPWRPAPGSLRRPHLRWLLLHAVGLSAVINLAVNAGWSWLTTLGRPAVPMWTWPVVGGAGTVMGALGILLVLPAATTVFCTLAVRREMALQKLAPLALVDLPPALSRLPAGLALRAATCGLVSLAVLGPVAAAAIILSGYGPAPTAGYIVYTGAVAVALGLVVTPLIALRAMADPPSGLPWPLAATTRKLRAGSR